MRRAGFVAAGALGLVLIGAVLLRGQPAPAENNAGKSTRTLVAYGSATVTGKVDMARVYLRVTTSAKTVDGARKENANAVGKVREAILALKLADLRTRTTDTAISIEHDRQSGKVTGYAVSHSFTFLVKEPDAEKLGISAGSILDAGLKNGVNQDGSIEFFKENDTDLRREAMTRAVADALANAKSLAAGADVKILDVVEIDGTLDTYRPIGMGGQGMSVDIRNDGDTSVSAGVWNVSRRVRIVCRY